MQVRALHSLACYRLGCVAATIPLPGIPFAVFAGVRVLRAVFVSGAMKQWREEWLFVFITFASLYQLARTHRVVGGGSACRERLQRE